MRNLLPSLSCWLVASSAFVVACGSDDGGGDPAGSSSGAASSSASGSGGSGATGVSCDSAPAELSLTGTWAAKARLTVSLEGAPGGAITLCPAGQEGEATMLLMVTIEQDSADPTQLSDVRAALCTLDLPIVTAKVGDCLEGDDNLVSTQLIAPPALLAGLPEVPADSATGTVGGTKGGASLDIQGLKVTVGATSSGRDLPTWKEADMACDDEDLGRSNQCDAMCVTDCASLRDDDGDGYPGVTIDVCGYTADEEASACNPADPSQTGVSVQGRAFLDIEVAPKLDGTAESSCELRGKVDTPILYNVVGADVYLGPGPISVTSAIKSLPGFHVAPDKSSFRMVRVDGQYGAPDWGIDPAAVGAACQTIISNVNEL